MNSSERLKARKNYNIPNDQIVIISIGNCNQVKNHFDIIKALADLISWEKNIIYLHVGEGESLAEEINLTNELGIDSYVKFAGTVDNVREALICSDIFVMTSKYEGVGNTSLEAGACGLPLIIYNSPGLRETVVDSYNGLIIEQNPKSLVKGLKKLISDNELSVSLGKNARKFVLDNHNMVESVNKILNVYEN